MRTVSYTQRQLLKDLLQAMNKVSEEAGNNDEFNDALADLNMFTESLDELIQRVQDEIYP